jgi:hypothetical protein
MDIANPLKNLKKQTKNTLKLLHIPANNVPPRIRDGGTRVWADAQGGRVEVPPNFRDFWEMGDGGTSNI